jgi:hypothetical protein
VLSSREGAGTTCGSYQPGRPGPCSRHENGRIHRLGLNGAGDPRNQGRT